MTISLSKKIDMFSYIWKLGYVCLKKSSFIDMTSKIM